MKRYEIDFTDLCEEPDGKWCKWKDVEEKLSHDASIILGRNERIAELS